MDRKAAIQHLVTCHGNRVPTLMKHVFIRSLGPTLDFDAMLNYALSHRSEFNNQYGVYE